MKRNTFKIIFLLYIVNYIYTQSPLPVFPELKPYYILDENLENIKILGAEDFMKLGLVASGSPASEIENYMDKLVRLWSGLDRDTLVSPENIFLYLHKNFFLEYNEHQTEISTVFDTGVYNCVSSAVIYMGFLKYTGFETSGVAVPDHAFCTVVWNDELIDVETTNPMGFDPGRKTSFTDSFGCETGYTYVPPGQYRQRTVLNDLEFLSLILQNRIHMLQNKNKHEEVISLAAQIYELTGNESDYDQYILMMTNWISWLDRKGLQEKGLVFLKDFSSAGVLPDTLKVSAGVVLNNRILFFLNQKKPCEARLLLDEYGFMANEKITGSLDKEIRRQIFFIKVYEQPGYDESLIYTKHNSDILSSGELSSVNDSLTYNELAGIYTASGAPDAYEWWLSLKTDKTRLYKSRDLSVQIRNSLVNDFHNLFAEAFNKRQWTSAEEILIEAEAYLGDHSLFKRDWQLLKKATQGQ